METELTPRNYKPAVRIAVLIGLVAVLAAVPALAQETAENAPAVAEAAESTPAGNIPLYMNPFWLLLFILSIVIWLLSVSWTSADARGTNLNIHMWGTILLVSGIPGAILSLLIHPALSFVTIAGVFVAFGIYIVQRNAQVPEMYRFLGPHHRAQILSKIPLLKKFAEGPGEAARAPSEITLPVTNAEGVMLADFAQNNPELADAAASVADALVRAASLQSRTVQLIPETEQYVIRLDVDGILHTVESVETPVAQKILGTMSQFLGLTEGGRMRPGKATLTGELPGTGELQIQAQIASRGGRPALSFELPDWQTDLHTHGLESLGMHEAIAKRIEAVLEQKTGGIVVCSPAQSGKTTTLFGVASKIDFFTTDIIIIEKEQGLPIEHVRRFMIPQDRSFSNFFEEIMREDPDDIVLTDLETPEQASCVLEFAAHEGMLVTSLTANSAPEALLRLARMGGAAAVSQAITCVISQQLIRTLCTQCREPVEPNPNLLEKLKIDPANPGQWFRPAGCDHCLGTGYRGRTGLFSMLILTEPVKQVLAAGNATEATIRDAAGKVAMRTLYQDGLGKVTAGITTLDEVRRVLKGK